MCLPYLTNVHVTLSASSGHRIKKQGFVDKNTLWDIVVPHILGINTLLRADTQLPFVLMEVAR